MRLAVGVRHDSPLRCAVCHDAIAGGVEACPGCGTVLHPDCRVELGGCPSLGCRVRVRARGPARRPWRSWQVAALVGGGLLSVLVCGGLSTTGEVISLGGFRPPPGPPIRLEGALLAGPARRVEVELVQDWSGASARVLLHGEQGRLLSHERFPVGWRVEGQAAAVVSWPGHDDRQLLRITCGSTFDRLDPCEEYFGVTPGGRLVLVRLERPTGALLDLGSYRTPERRVGPLPPRRPQAAWQAALASSDPVELLEALHWLGGAHEDGGVEGAEVAELRADATTRALVDALAASPERWVAEAARAARTTLLLARAAAARPEWSRRLDGHDRAGALALLDALGEPPPDLWPVDRLGDLSEDLRWRARLRASFGRIDPAIADLTRAMELAPGDPWARFLRGVARLQAGDREGGLADLQPLPGTSAHLLPYRDLWRAAITGEAAPAPPPVAGELWLEEVWRCVTGERPADGLLARVEAAPGRHTPTERRCVALCFLGVVLERQGQVDAACERYRACVAVGEVRWVQHAWALGRLHALQR